MSKRRGNYEIVFREPGKALRENYGWTGILLLMPEAEHCRCNKQCGDPECVEWNTARILNRNGSPVAGDPTDHHICECEMEDVVIDVDDETWDETEEGLEF